MLKMSKKIIITVGKHSKYYAYSYHRFAEGAL